MLSDTCAVAELPATSVTVPLTTWFAPSVLMVCACGQVASGAVVLVQVKVTVTAELFQPLALGWGDTEAVICGGTLAMFSVTLAVFVFPAASVTVPVTICPAPSVLMVCGAGQLVIEEVEAVQVKLTVTLVLFHP
jgi:hypothetical protein